MDTGSCMLDSHLEDSIRHHSDTGDSHMHPGLMRNERNVYKYHSLQDLNNIIVKACCPYHNSGILGQFFYKTKQPPDVEKPARAF